MTTATPDAPAEERDEARESALGLVISRELRTRAASKSFLVSTLFSLALLTLVIVVPAVVGGGPTTHEVGVVGEASARIVSAAERLVASRDDGSSTTRIETTEYPDADAAERAVVDGEVDAAVVDGTRVMVARAGGFGSTPLVGLLQQAAGAEQITATVGEADAARIDDALSGTVLEVSITSGQDAAHAEGRTWLAYGGALLMYMLIMQYGTWALNGVTEEKANRVIEILLSTAPPWQLFAGKIIGIALLGLGQFAILLIAALTAIRVTGAFDLPVLPLDFAGVLGLWVLLGFAVYLVLFGCAGALAARMEDAQSAISPIMILGIMGFFASFNVLGNPDGPVANVGTFIPFFAPFIVPIRAALETIPLWQHALSVVLSLVAAGALTAFAGRIYRGGALQFGGKVSWKKAFQQHP